MNYAQFKTTTIKCDCCGVPLKEIFMKQVERRGLMVRFRRLHCELCDNVISVFGNGFNDLVKDPSEAIKDVDNMFKQELDARK